MFHWKYLAGAFVIVVPLSLALAQAPPAPPPPVSLSLGMRHGHVMPARCGFAHTGGGNTDVAQPSPDTVVVTMTGVVVAGGHPCTRSTASMEFDLVQALEVSFDNPKVKKAKLNVEARVIGLLRSECKGEGSASEGPGCATLSPDQGETISVCAPTHSVSAGENLSVNDHDGPVESPVAGTKYTLHQTFTISATRAKSIWPTKAVSAEFAPDPALDPLWISYWEPFHGAIKKDFGFQVTIKVAPDADAPPEKKNEAKP
jgi:hypothetical protein